MRNLVTQTISVPTNGIRLHAEIAGPEDGPLVILLHGFPENWAGWVHQIGPLARSGFRVVAPDQRGYNLSDKPRDIEAYRLEELVQDVLGLIDAFGRDRAFIVGHDWGAAVAWQVAIRYPERVEKLVILNVPHPAAHARSLFKEPFSGQFLRSWYIYFFQIPGLPEHLLRLNRFWGLRNAIRTTAKHNSFSKQELDRYVEAWRQPGALTGMINWYRAALRGVMASGSQNGYRKSAQQRVTVPTLVLWGERDVALVRQLAPWSMEWVDDGHLVRFPEATHWVQHDEAERVTNRILDFFESE